MIEIKILIKVFKLLIIVLNKIIKKIFNSIFLIEKIIILLLFLTKIQKFFLILLIKNKIKKNNIQ